ncbi:hypothetical protein BCD67_06450 [Oscillatoriales cyanobacterium USR001]|nr:hypothetical protein BCD67_06450 [Oscillatoriales cyanobacterium USR001]
MTKVSVAEIEQMHDSLLEDSHLNLNYMVLTVSACLIASFGLLSNSAAVIIGAMIIAPLMMPLRGLAFAALEGNTRLFRRSLISLFVATAVGILLSCFLGVLVDLPEFGSEVLARTQPNLIDLGIAVVAGGMSGFAKTRPKVGDAMAGTAIAVALMPPLCVVGLSLSQGFWQFSWGAFLLYLTNFLGIILACMVVFIWAGYGGKSKTKRALASTLALTAVLVIPLGISFAQLVRQVQLQASLKKILVSRTVTVGQQVELIRTNVDWTANPPVVHLDVLANEPLTSKQVDLVEKFIQKEMKRPFRLVFRVREVREVRSKDLPYNPNSAP